MHKDLLGIWQLQDDACIANSVDWQVRAVCMISDCTGKKPTRAHEPGCPVHQDARSHTCPEKLHACFNTLPIVKLFLIGVGPLCKYDLLAAI